LRFKPLSKDAREGESIPFLTKTERLGSGMDGKKKWVKV
jgi:hypothetical protein